jgi:hypothetical protein
MTQVFRAGRVEQSLRHRVLAIILFSLITLLVIAPAHGQQAYQSLYLPDDFPDGRFERLSDKHPFFLYRVTTPSCSSMPMVGRIFIHNMAGPGFQEVTKDPTARQKFMQDAGLLADFQDALQKDRAAMTGAQIWPPHDITRRVDQKVNSIMSFIRANSWRTDQLMLEKFPPGHDWDLKKDLQINGKPNYQCFLYHGVLVEAGDAANIVFGRVSAGVNKSLDDILGKANFAAECHSALHGEGWCEDQTQDQSSVMVGWFEGMTRKPWSYGDLYKPQYFINLHADDPQLHKSLDGHREKLSQWNPLLQRARQLYEQRQKPQEKPKAKARPNVTAVPSQHIIPNILQALIPPAKAYSQGSRGNQVRTYPNGYQLYAKPSTGKTTVWCYPAGTANCPVSSDSEMSHHVHGTAAEQNHPVIYQGTSHTLHNGR